MALHNNGLLQANSAFINGKWLQAKDDQLFDVLGTRHLPFVVLVLLAI